MDLFTDTKPDLVLLDIKMPEMDGIDVLRRIMEMDPSAYVVMLTSVDEAKSVAICMAAGAKDYVRKGLPFDEVATPSRAYRSNEAFSAGRLVF